MTADIEHKTAMDDLLTAFAVEAVTLFAARVIEAERSMHSYAHITDPTFYRQAINSDWLRQQVDLAEAALAFVLAVQKVKAEIKS